MADRYQFLARHYDRFTAGALAGARAGVIRACNALGARRVLDLGCGTGLLAADLVRYPATAEVPDAVASSAKAESDTLPPVRGKATKPAGEPSPITRDISAIPAGDLLQSASKMPVKRALSPQMEPELERVGEAPDVVTERTGESVAEPLETVTKLAAGSDPDLCRAWALDFSPAMLAEARTRRNGLEDRLLFIQGNTPLPFAPRSLDAVILFLVVHESERGDELLEQALTLAPTVLAVDWRMPERNLDYRYLPLIHCVERLAGKEHYRQFLRYARGGWLRGALGRAGGVVVREQVYLGGMLSLVQARAKNSGPDTGPAES